MSQMKTKAIPNRIAEAHKTSNDFPISSRRPLIVPPEKGSTIAAKILKVIA